MKKVVVVYIKGNGKVVGIDVSDENIYSSVSKELVKQFTGFDISYGNIVDATKEGNRFYNNYLYTMYHVEAESVDDAVKVIEDIIDSDIINYDIETEEEKGTYGSYIGFTVCALAGFALGYLVSK